MLPDEWAAWFRQCQFKSSHRLEGGGIGFHISAALFVREVRKTKRGCAERAAP
jgi:hypothetical protein